MPQSVWWFLAAPGRRLYVAGVLAAIIAAGCIAVPNIETGTAKSEKEKHVTTSQPVHSPTQAPDTDQQGFWNVSFTSVTAAGGSAVLVAALWLLWSRRMAKGTAATQLEAMRILAKAVYDTLALALGRKEGK